MGESLLLHFMQFAFNCTMLLREVLSESWVVKVQVLPLLCLLTFPSSVNQYCHTRPYLGFPAQLKFFQVSACKMGPRSGIIISQTASQPASHPPDRLHWKLNILAKLSNHWSDHIEILNWDLGDQSIVFKYFNEDDHPWKTTSKY